MEKTMEVYDTEKCQRVAEWYYGMPEHLRVYLENCGYMVREHEFR